jgi:cobalt-zinc-cadmium efflux system membrane fusion protein
MCVRLIPFWGVFAMAAALASCRQAGDLASREVVEAAAEAHSVSLTISPEGQVAIGLESASAARTEVRQSIAATGWLAARPASEVIVKAPATGFVTLREDSPISLGDSVARNQGLAELQVFLSPQEQAQLVAAKEEADILIQQSLATLKLAEEQLSRLEEVASTAVAGTRLFELREVVAHSRAAEREARDKLPFLPAEPYEEDIKLKAVPLNAPLSGRLVNVHFAPRQLVVQGEPLWTIADWSRLWIRVPVYAPDVARVDQTDPVSVVVPGAKDVRDAKPINIPQATEPGKQTVELVYEIDNVTGQLRPGQSVSVSLPSGQPSEEIVIPRSAIIWDGMGNSWVYLQTSATTFRRRKVELGQLLEDTQVVRRGLAEGDSIVVVGAEALYGEEFQWEIRAEEDD